MLSHTKQDLVKMCMSLNHRQSMRTLGNYNSVLDLDPYELKQAEYNAVLTTCLQENYLINRETCKIEDYTGDTSTEDESSRMCSVEQLFSNLQEHRNTSGFFMIPAYQRRYSWRTRQITDLWNDVVCLVQLKRDAGYALHPRLATKTQSISLDP